MVNVYIGLGSNLDQPAEKIKQAQLTLSEQAQIKVLKTSNLYTSPPMGPSDQPDYVNAVMSFQTDLSPHELLKLLQSIENNFGRDRDVVRWGARTLDLDILLYGEQQISHPDLKIPHIGLSKRAFVLYPLQEIAPADLIIPGKGDLQQLISQCPLEGLEKIADAKPYRK